jgi:HK97 gp10 family phage protein
MASFNHWNNVASAIKPAMKAVVRKVALDGEGNVKAEIQANDLIDTGFMFNSVYNITSDSSTYTGGGKAFPELARPGEMEAYIVVAAEYAIYPNYGTVHQPPRPFFEPGIERTRAGFDKAMQLLKQRMEAAAR